MKLPITTQIKSLNGVYSPKFIAMLEFVFNVPADERIVSPQVAEMTITGGGTVLQYGWYGDVGMNGFEAFRDFENNLMDVLGYLEYTRAEAEPVIEVMNKLRANELVFVDTRIPA
jgi:hypothetical protein